MWCVYKVYVYPLFSKSICVWHANKSSLWKSLWIGKRYFFCDRVQLTHLHKHGCHIFLLLLFSSFFFIFSSNTLFSPCFVYSICMIFGSIYIKHIERGKWLNKSCVCVCMKHIGWMNNYAYQRCCCLIHRQSMLESNHCMLCCL